MTSEILNIFCGDISLIPFATVGNPNFIVGLSCYNQGEAYCFNGKCSSHNSQCSYIWGEEATSATELCYTTYNHHGEYYNIVVVISIILNIIFTIDSQITKLGNE